MKAFCLVKLSPMSDSDQKGDLKNKALRSNVEICNGVAHVDRLQPCPRVQVGGRGGKKRDQTGSLTGKERRVHVPVRACPCLTERGCFHAPRPPLPNVSVGRDDKGDPGPSRAREESSVTSFFLRLPVSLIAGLPVKRSRRRKREHRQRPGRQKRRLRLAAVLFCTIRRNANHVAWQRSFYAKRAKLTTKM